MLATNRLLFVALPKTASTHLLDLLARLVGGERRYQHSIVEPDDFVPGRRFLGSIRSPWTYYLSLWAFGCRGLGGFYLSMARDPELADLYADVRDPDRFRRWLRVALYGPDIFGAAQRTAATAGLLTRRFCQFFLRPGYRDRSVDGRDHRDLARHVAAGLFIDEFIRVENLERDLLSALSRCGYELDAAQRAVVRSARRTNAAPRKLDPAHYYDDGLIERVGEADRLIVDRFGYRWPDRLDAGPTWTSPRVTVGADAPQRGAP